MKTGISPNSGSVRIICTSGSNVSLTEATEAGAERKHDRHGGAGREADSEPLE